MHGFFFSSVRIGEIGGLELFGLRLCHAVKICAIGGQVSILSICENLRHLR
jgi:hypothetical protein